MSSVVSRSVSVTSCLFFLLFPVLVVEQALVSDSAVTLRKLFFKALVWTLSPSGDKRCERKVCDCFRKVADKSSKTYLGVCRRCGLVYKYLMQARYYTNISWASVDQKNICLTTSRISFGVLKLFVFDFFESRIKTPAHLVLDYYLWQLFM